MERSIIHEREEGSKGKPMTTTTMKIFVLYKRQKERERKKRLFFEATGDQVSKKIQSAVTHTLAVSLTLSCLLPVDIKCI